MLTPLLATTDARAATDNFATAGAVALVLRSARDLELYSPVREVVLLPPAELHLVSEARYESMRLTVLAEDGAVDEVNDDATDVLREVALRLGGDLARHDLPVAEPGRYACRLDRLGEVPDRSREPGPPDRWDLDRLRDPRSRRPVFDTMSRAEVREHFAEQERRSRERFRGFEVGRVDPAKKADHPHLRQTGWGVSFVAGARVLVRLDSPDAEPRVGVVVGLRGAEGGLVLVVDLGADGVWAARRDDDQAWAESLDAGSGSVPDREVHVGAWPLDVAPSEGETVPEPRAARRRHGWLRTTLR